MVDRKRLEWVVVDHLAKHQAIPDIHKLLELKEVEDELLKGFCVIKHGDSWFSIPISDRQSRDVTVPETEATVTGQRLAFNENLQINLNLLRNTVRSKDLVIEQWEIGTASPRSVCMAYIEGKAQAGTVQQIKERIQAFDIEYLEGSSHLEQLLNKRTYSVFPSMLHTERVDRVTAQLLAGRIALFVDGNPFVLTAPHRFIENLQSPEDYQMNWLMGSALRLLRITSFFIGFVLTPFYVAIVTFHYLVIPPELMVLLAESRSQVPFTPMVEALLMEVAIELLRETGSRLPERVGQTVGIVGGIVIGQAAVTAGLTSNILLIVVALSMLATLVLPFQLSNSVRILRFPLLFAAGVFGGLGVMIGMFLIVTYLCRLKHFEEPYFSPQGALLPERLLDSAIRAPFQKMMKKEGS
ncbi:spore germination protein I [Halalkalibacterium halodurans C-125]|uniref:Spore germination protein I n=2 Tax=Halalkalibacterium halodurans TaxID=86665 RepID=Q9KAU8_HALH5|nr:spore germination protein I [Halalkalibacterium halodurans C-125]